MKERSDEGNEEFRTGGIQKMKDTRRSVQVRREADHKRCCTVYIHMKDTEN